MRRLFAALLLGSVASCLLITEFDVEPAPAGTGGSAGDGTGAGGSAGAGTGAAAGQGGSAGGVPGPCEEPSCLLVSFPDRRLKHVDVEPEPDGRIYYSTELMGTGGDIGELRRVDKNGADDQRIASLPDGDVDFVKVGSSRVYYTSYSLGMVQSVQKNGNFDITHSTQPGPLSGLALGGPQKQHVFWHDHHLQALPGIAPAGMAEEPLTDAPQDNGFGMVVDPDDYSQVYWTTWGTSEQNGTVVWRPEYATVHVIENAAAKPSGIALDDTFVYWIDSWAAIRRHTRGVASTPTVPPVGISDIIVDPEARFAGFGAQIAVDDTHVYWGAVGGVYRALKDGSGDTEQMLSADIVNDIAMDADAIYAVTWDDGELFIIAK